MTRDHHAPPYRVAVLVAPGVNQAQVLQSVAAFTAAGVEVEVVAQRQPGVRAHGTGIGPPREMAIDLPLDQARPERYQAVLLPSEVVPDALSRDTLAMSFLRAMVAQGRIVAAIGRGSNALLGTSLPHGRRLTSSLELETELRRAGARWVDVPVVIDGNLITGRNGDEVAAVCEAVLAGLARLGPMPFTYGAPSPAACAGSCSS